MTVALLVIDVQRGAFDGARCPPIAAGAELVERTLALVEAARAGATPVVFVQHCAPAGDPFEEGTAHGDLHDSLVPLPGESVIRKRAESAFEGTELGRTLAELGVRNLVLCGLQSDACVFNTAAAALDLGYAIALAADAHSTWPSGGETAHAISARINAQLSSRGAQLASTAALVARLRDGAT